MNHICTYVYVNNASQGPSFNINLTNMSQPAQTMLAVNLVSFAYSLGWLSECQATVTWHVIKTKLCPHIAYDSNIYLTKAASYRLPLHHPAVVSWYAGVPLLKDAAVKVLPTKLTAVLQCPFGLACHTGCTWSFRCSTINAGASCRELKARPKEFDARPRSLLWQSIKLAQWPHHLLAYSWAVLACQGICYTAANQSVLPCLHFPHCSKRVVFSYWDTLPHPEHPWFVSNEYWLQKNQTGFHPQCTHVQDGYQLASASCLCTSHMATNFVGMSSDVMFLLLGARFDWTAMLPLTEHGILLSWSQGTPKKEVERQLPASCRIWYCNTERLRLLQTKPVSAQMLHLIKPQIHLKILLAYYYRHFAASSIVGILLA